MGKRKISLSNQRTAAEILTAFMFVKDMDEFTKVWDKFFDLYELRNDPFTYCPCAPEDYYKSQLNFEKQIMMEKYGHCDGLD